MTAPASSRKFTTFGKRNLEEKGKMMWQIDYAEVHSRSREVTHMWRRIKTGISKKKPLSLIAVKYKHSFNNSNELLVFLMKPIS